MKSSKRARQRQRQAEARKTVHIRKGNRRIGREETHIQIKSNVVEAMQFTYDATLSHTTPCYMEVQRHPGCEALVAQHRAVAHDDAMFAKYKKITGQKSCLIYCLDTTDWKKDTELDDMTEVVFVVSIELYEDMDIPRRDHYQWMFHYLRRDAASRPSIKSKSEGSKSGNHAMLGRLPPRHLPYNTANIRRWSNEGHGLACWLRAWLRYRDLCCHAISTKAHPE